MKISRVGVDLAKNVFQIHGADSHGKAVWKRKLSRKRWIEAICTTVPERCEIGMEACSGAHHWARRLSERGFRVKLIPPQFVTPYVKSNKNDANDAEAICEAMSRPNMRFVKMKSVEQQDIQAIHRVRAELMSHRTAKANQIRGLVAEYGLVAPQRVSALRKALPLWLEDAENGLTDRFRHLLNDLRDDLIYLEKRIATVGNGEQFTKGRQMSASIGLTPKQFSSGGKDRLLGISKRGDAYLRTILIHGARATMVHAKHRDDRLSVWVTDLAKRSHPNVAAVALANKTVRMAWAMMKYDADYDEERAAS